MVPTPTVLVIDPTRRVLPVLRAATELESLMLVPVSDEDLASCDTLHELLGRYPQAPAVLDLAPDIDRAWRLLIRLRAADSRPARRVFLTGSSRPGRYEGATNLVAYQVPDHGGGAVALVQELVRAVQTC